MSASASFVDVLKCSACGALDAGPREICPGCHASALRPDKVSGAGALLSWTIIRRPPAAFRAEGSYTVAVVELDAGIKVTGRLEAADEKSRLGARVVMAESRSGVPVFRLA